MGPLAGARVYHGSRAWAWSLFTYFLDKLAEDVQTRSGVPLSVPRELAECRSTRKEGVIRSWAWSLPGIRRLRATRLDAGSALQVFNAVAFPETDRLQPLLGIDLLQFGLRNKLVAVMDFQPLSQDPHYLERYMGGLKALQQRFPAFAQGEEMRSYDANRYFSPWLLFARGPVTDLKESLRNAFELLLSAYWALHDAEQPDPRQQEEVAALQRDYARYSVQKDPAHGLFTSYFGKSWADRFLHEFLFPESTPTNTTP